MTTKIEKISPKIYKVTDNDKHLGTISETVKYFV